MSVSLAVLFVLQASCSICFNMLNIHPNGKISMFACSRDIIKTNCTAVTLTLVASILCLSFPSRSKLNVNKITWPTFLLHCFGDHDSNIPSFFFHGNTFLIYVYRIRHLLRTQQEHRNENLCSSTVTESYSYWRKWKGRLNWIVWSWHINKRRMRHKIC